MLTLTLPLPPSTNGLYIPANGRLVLSVKGKKYHRSVLTAIFLAGQPKAPPGRLRANLDIYPARRGKSDIANREKVLSDALKDAGVIEDDSLIDEWLIRRCEVVKDGKAVITLMAIEETKP